jgi:hypothetical protein
MLSAGLDQNIDQGVDIIRAFIDSATGATAPPTPRGRGEWGARSNLAANRSASVAPNLSTMKA